MPERVERVIWLLIGMLCGVLLAGLVVFGDSLAFFRLRLVVW